MTKVRSVDIEAIERLLVIFVNHIRPDGRFSYFTYEEQEVVKQLAERIGYKKPPTVEPILSEEYIEKITDLLEAEWGYEGIREDVSRILRGGRE